MFKILSGRKLLSEMYIFQIEFFGHSIHIFLSKNVYNYSTPAQWATELYK